MKKPLPEIVKCACGKKAAVHEFNRRYHVRCGTNIIPNCWIGADRHSRRAAINAWNRVMRKEDK